MAELPVIRVRWPKRFGPDPVWINAADFDSALHTRVDNESDPVAVAVDTTAGAADAPPPSVVLAVDTDESEAPRVRRRR